MPSNRNSTPQLRSGTVAIVVPWYNRETLTPDEEISLRHLVCYLGPYDRFIAAPEGLRVNRPGFEVMTFDISFFGSSAANKRLMLSRKFYEAFVDYEYILLYQLDALVFSDQLKEWCAHGFDYIGAPWIKCNDTPRVTVPRVGNGGLSLRKVESFLKVIDSQAYGTEPDDYWQKYFGSQPKYIQFLNLPKRYLMHLKTFNNVHREMARYGHNDDRFWSDEAFKYYPDFKIAPFELGLKFSFEASPTLCFEMNNNTLPFGCHAWPKYDRGFWQPYLLSTTQDSRGER